MSSLNSPGVIDQKSVSPWPTGGRYGIIAGMALVAVGLVFYVSGLVDVTQQGGTWNWISSLVNYAIMGVAIYLAAKFHRDEELGGFMTYGRGLGIGTIASLVMALVSVIWTILFFTVIAPDLPDEIRYQMREQMIEQQGMSESDVDQAMGFAGVFAQPGVLAAFAGFFTFLFGFVVSLIIGAVLRKDPPTAA